LGLVRYAESDGYRGDHYRPQAYRYRDYVIRSFNSDKPYTQFVLEQLAGDEVAPNDQDALIATGFMRLPIYEWNQRDAMTHWETILQDMTDVTADVFLGSGLQCAKCHDHKFDPILQKDYYALRAFFTPVIWRDDVPVASEGAIKERNDFENKSKAIYDEIAALEAPLREKAYDIAIKMFPDDVQDIMKKAEDKRDAYEQQIAYLVMRQGYFEWGRYKGKSAIKEQKDALIAKLPKKRPKTLPKGMTVSDASSVAPSNKIPGTEEEILPGFMTVLYPDGADVNAKIVKPELAPNSTGRRTALAKWITSPSNPLTTRVIVNRLWQYHFGRGIVANPNDFGKLGEKPTHPELLDWLVQEFMKNGWRFKPMHKMIMMSKSYQMSTKHDDAVAYMLKDPTNLFHWKRSDRRLEAEALRDSMLAVSGELKQRSKGGAPVLGTTPNRSVYVKVVRNTKDEFLNAFDWADAFASNAVRNVTTTPVQSLLMMNGPWVMKRSSTLASKLIKEHKKNNLMIVEDLYRRAYGRVPAKGEMNMAMDFLQSQKLSHGNRDKELKEKSGMHTARMKNGLNAITSKGRRDFFRLLTKDVELLTSGDFTIEAKVQVNSYHTKPNSLTVITSQRSNGAGLSWALGLTSTKSKHKPGTLVLKLWNGKSKDVIVSDLQLDLNKPYYIGVIADTSKANTKVKFFVKDYTSKKSPMNNYQAVTKTVLKSSKSASGSILMFTDKDTASWDGMIGELKMTRKALETKDLMFDTVSPKSSSTLAHWHFATDDELLKDASKNGYHLELLKEEKVSASAAHKKAVADLCQVIFNSSEFLYVR
ncbi:MAG: DUF1549 and DUF1553 domain-containing protein, partial [Lentisphaeraceae bacterium]|nr:DUF1549 and DUF1553 domain-containing protein [Lentisphaeraceae bacterium]